ncbi:MAG: 16S rRNA (adenine(1518)-N(6)/adenine(1519)-N(6))-dimethyltransferase RsmA [Candidatus Methylomirabilales bacterium]
MASLLGETRRLLLTHGLRPKKRLGQSFLVDRTILHKILEGGSLRREDQVLEIGGGVGTLTRALAERCRRVVAVEIDAGLFRILEQLLGGRPEVTLVHGDALRLDFESLLGAEGSWKVVANLPYAVATPLMTRLLEESHRFSLLLLMMQEEVAERLVASPGEKAYGSLTVLTRYYADVRVVARVSRAAFYPRPRVDSVLVRLEVLPTPRVAPRDPTLFFRLVRAAFGHRRKTLKNALSQAGWAPLDRQAIQAVLVRAGIDPHRRGETLTLQEFQVLADELLSHIGNSSQRLAVSGQQF